MRFAGAGTESIEPLDELNFRSHYYAGSRENWHTDIRNYARLRYANVYPGIDVVFYGSGRKLEFDFIVQPGANVRATTLAYVNSRSVLSGGSAAIAMDTGTRATFSFNGTAIKWIGYRCVVGYSECLH